MASSSIVQPAPVRPRTISPDGGSGNATPLTPLAVILPFVFLNSMGSGVVSNGIFFIARDTFQFTRLEIFALGVVYGLAYIPAALSIGPLLRRMPKAHPLLNTRGAVGAVMLGMGALCWLPWAVAGAGQPPKWTMWALMFCYAGFSGMLWPMVESFLSGGRVGRPLRSAMGRFNVTWSAALVVAILLLGPLAERHALLALQGLGLIHVFAGLLLAGFARNPAPHPPAHQHAHAGNDSAGHLSGHPPMYHELLVLFKFLLPMAYLVLAALGPFLPIVTNTLKLAPFAALMVTSVWMASRVVAFFIAERWHGWHGTRATPYLGAGMLLGGFALVVLGPPNLPQTAGLVVFIMGLAAFGIGMGVIYTATLYYTMAVGSSEVEAGGLFEALIGSGYVLGPLSGVMAVILVDRQSLAPQSLEPFMLAVVAIVAAGLFACGVVKSRRAAVPR